MIVSITCRHGTESKALRKRADADCRALAKYMPAITRVQVIFSKRSHRKKAPDLVTCHILIQIPHKRHIDIYEHQATGNLALSKAMERVAEQLSRLQPRRRA